MIQPEMIVAQIEQGERPENWHILHGRGSPAVMAIFFGFFTLFFVGMCAVALEAGSFFFGVFSSSQTQSGSPGFNGGDPLSPTPSSSGSANLLSMFLMVNPLFLLIPIILAIGVGIFTWSRMSFAKDSLLILMPEGVVQCLGYSKPARRTFKVLAYEEVAQMDFRVRSTASYNQTTHMSSSTTRMWLDILKRNGMRERWMLNRLYEAPETTAQQIIAGHAQYMALHPQNLKTF